MSFVRFQFLFVVELGVFWTSILRNFMKSQWSAQYQCIPTQPCSHTALTRSSLICWENNRTNNKTMDPSPENNRAVWYQGPLKLEVVKSCVVSTIFWLTAHPLHLIGFSFHTNNRPRAGYFRIAFPLIRWKTNVLRPKITLAQSSIFTWTK